MQDSSVVAEEKVHSHIAFYSEPIINQPAGTNVQSGISCFEAYVYVLTGLTMFVYRRL